MDTEGKNSQHVKHENQKDAGSLKNYKQYPFSRRSVAKSKRL